MKTGFPQWTKHIHLWTSYSPTYCCAEFKVILEAGMAYTEQYTRKSQIRSRDEMVNFGWQSKVCNHEIKLKPLWKNHTDDDSLGEAHPFWALKPLKKSPPPSPHANSKMHLFNIFVWVSTHQPISNWSFSGELLLPWETQWHKFPIFGAFKINIETHWNVGDQFWFPFGQ